MTTENPVPNSEQGKRQELLGRKEAAWNDFYLKGNFLGVKPIYDELYRVASEWQVGSETMVEIIADKAWNEYFIDKNGTTKTNTSYLSAKNGLERLKDSGDSSDINVVRSRLFEVAGLSQAYLVDEADEPAEPLFRSSVEEAEKSAVTERIGEAKNGFALWLISPKQKRFQDAIPLFEDVARIQEEIGNKRTAGHGHNNLVVCYNETGRFEKAVEEADKALELYGDPNLNHSFSTRFRKSLSLRRLGRFEEALAIYELHKNLRTRDPNISEQDKARLIANEDKNIETTKKEMEKLI
ncbi:MAG: tetratricopeptide repeat protein [Candidatus Levybacteria bacterium]|nr:tetratricopeptide repeat protein [Candidatus Levybacteria bacterium]